MSEIINVKITAKQTCTYEKTVQMTKLEWAQFKRMEQRDVQTLGDVWLDTTDESDWQEVDINDVEAVVVDETGQPLEPRDDFNR